MASIGSLGGLLRLVMLTFALTLAACSNSTDLPAGSVASPPFYEITNSDGTVEGWIFGTIHALPADTRWRTSTIDTVIAEADFLVVEVAALDDRMKMARIFRELDDTPDLPPMSDRIPENLHHRLVGVTAKGRIDMRTLSRSETWAAALLLAQIEAKGDPEYGVDRALIRAFAGRDIRELEGAIAQLQIFDQLPETAQRDLLIEVIRGSDEQNDQAQNLQMAWLAGDLAALEKASETGILAVPALRTALLTERNQRWMVQLELALKDTRRPLIAVGAAHLIGPEGLIALLEHRGLVINRVQ